MMQIYRGLLLTLKRMISYNVGYGVLIAPIKSSAFRPPSIIGKPKHNHNMDSITPQDDLIPLPSFAETKQNDVIENLSQDSDINRIYSAIHEFSDIIIRI